MYILLQQLDSIQKQAHTKIHTHTLEHSINMPGWTYSRRCGCCAMIMPTSCVRSGSNSVHSYWGQRAPRFASSDRHARANTLRALRTKNRKPNGRVHDYLAVTSSARLIWQPPLCFGRWFLRWLCTFVSHDWWSMIIVNRRTECCWLTHLWRGGRIVSIRDPFRICIEKWHEDSEKARASVSYDEKIIAAEIPQTLRPTCSHQIHLRSNTNISVCVCTVDQQRKPNRSVAATAIVIIVAIIIDNIIASTAGVQIIKITHAFSLSRRRECVHFCVTPRRCDISWKVATARMPTSSCNIAISCAAIASLGVFGLLFVVVCRYMLFRSICTAHRVRISWWPRHDDDDDDGKHAGQPHEIREQGTPKLRYTKRCAHQRCTCTMCTFDVHEQN